MFKKLLASIGILALLSPIAHANFQAVAPEQVIPSGLDLVVNLDLKQAPLVGPYLRELVANTGEESMIQLMEIGTKNKLTFGFGKMDQYEEFEDMYIATKMNRTQFESITKEFGQYGIEKRGQTVKYYCDDLEEYCFGRLGSYFYLTNSERNMDGMIRNFHNGERDVLAYDADYTGSQAVALPDSFADIYLSFETIISELENELYMFDDGMFFGDLMGLIESLKYESFSLATTENKFSGRMYLKHDLASMKNLSFAYKALMFRPNLHNYVDADGMVMYFEGSNLKERFKMVENLLYEEMDEEIIPVFDFVKLLDGGMAFAMRAEAGETIPHLTFMAEIKRNNQRQIKAGVEELVAMIEAEAAASDEAYEEWGMTNPTPVKIEMIKDGLYEISVGFDDYTAEMLEEDSFTFKMGISNGMLLISNDDTAGERHNNAGTAFKKSVRGPINTVGVGYMDFQALHDYIVDIDERYDLYMDEDALEMLSGLELLTMKAYAKMDSVRMDVSLTHSLKSKLNTLFESIKRELPF